MILGRIRRPIFLLTLACLSACSTLSGPASQGVASWYGIDFHGRKTASGEVFNMYAFTAAHRTYPFGTRLKVTSLTSGKSVVVRVNDRGPFTKNRIIDLSFGAAKKIGMIGKGRDDVRIEVLGDRLPSSER